MSDEKWWGLLIAALAVLALAMALTVYLLRSNGDRQAVVELVKSGTSALEAACAVRGCR